MAGSTVIQLKRGVDANLAGASLVAAEAFVVTDTQKFGFTPDGSTKILLASESFVTSAIAAANTQNWKAPVKAASVTALTLSGAQTVDGVSLVAGDRVLVKNQASAITNGVYVVAAGAWTRAIDFNSTSAVQAAVVPVSEGTVNADRSFIQNNDDVVIGTDTLDFTEFTPGVIDGGTF